MVDEDKNKDEIIKRLDDIENAIEFLVKEHIRLHNRVVNIGIAIGDHLDFTNAEEDSILNPSNDYDEEERIIKRLKHGNETCNNKDN